MVFWHPNGWTIYQVLEQYMRKVQQDNGYLEIKTPQVVDLVLWEKSGHAANYADNMLSLGKVDAAVLSAIVAGACVGFLRHNFYPARIFMGDSGALLLGFVLATVSVQGLLKTASTVTLFLPLLVLAVPILDTSFVVARRRKELGIRLALGAKPGFVIWLIMREVLLLLVLGLALKVLATVPFTLVLFTYSFPLL